MKNAFSKTTFLFLGLILTLGLSAQKPNQVTFEKYLAEVYGAFERGDTRTRLSHLGYG